jgi:prepilin-type N-terminal cleavage/methylation domain-containing protein
MRRPRAPFASARRTPTRRFHSQRGFSTVELLVVLAVSGLLAGITITGGMHLLDAAAVETAARSTVELFAQARDQALAASGRVAVHLDSRSARVLVHRGADTVARAHFGSSGVLLRTTRDSMAYAANGLGVGAANLRIVLSRGRRSDTITVSRLGRVQRQ